jgi:hypothetical protein
VRRRLFNVLAAVSLVLCAVVATLWRQSHARECGIMLTDSTDRRPNGKYYDRYGLRLSARDGISAVNWEYHTFPYGVLPSPTTRPSWMTVEPGWYASWSTPSMFTLKKIFMHRGFHIFGFQIFREGHVIAGYRTSYVFCAMPIWFLACLAAILPLHRARAWRRDRWRRLEHRCECCGYDLRATPERCPECGTAVKAAG